MKFLFIIHHDERFRATESLVADIHGWIGEMSRRGVRVHGNPLRPAAEAVTIRVRDGVVLRSEGPVSDGAEKVAAYELVECDDLAEALDLASSHPMAAAATIEVRQVWSELADSAGSKSRTAG